MKPRTLVIFGVVTAVITAAALITVASRYWISTAASVVRPFPGLLDHINDVAEIDVKTKDGVTVLKRTGSGWVMTDKHDYPVQSDMASGAAIGFADMEFTERKTAEADRYVRLGVEDIDSKDAKSRLVTLKNAKGETLAELIVGRGREGRMGGQGGLYVRRPGEAQSWFAPANFEIPSNTAAWLEPRIIHVNSKRVAEITTVQPNGDTLVIYKDTPQTRHFAFRNLPADKKLKGEAVADDLDTVLTAVDLDDVAPQSEVDFSQKAWHAEVKTFDGLDVKLDIVDRSGAPWARLVAVAEKAKVDAGTQPDDVKKFLETADQVTAEAAEINNRTGKWAYELKPVQAEKLEADLSIFLENETPGQGGAPTGGFGPGDLGGPGGGFGPGDGPGEPGGGK